MKFILYSKLQDILHSNKRPLQEESCTVLLLIKHSEYATIMISLLCQKSSPQRLLRLLYYPQPSHQFEREVEHRMRSTMLSIAHHIKQPTRMQQTWSITQVLVGLESTVKITLWIHTGSNLTFLLFVLPVKLALSWLLLMSERMSLEVVLEVSVLEVKVQFCWTFFCKA